MAKIRVLCLYVSDPADATEQVTVYYTVKPVCNDHL